MKTPLLIPVFAVFLLTSCLSYTSIDDIRNTHLGDIRAADGPSVEQIHAINAPTVSIERNAEIKTVAGYGHFDIQYNGLRLSNNLLFQFSLSSAIATPSIASIRNRVELGLGKLYTGKHRDFFYSTSLAIERCEGAHGPNIGSEDFTSLYASKASLGSQIGYTFKLNDLRFSQSAKFNFNYVPQLELQQVFMPRDGSSNGWKMSGLGTKNVMYGVLTLQGTLHSSDPVQIAIGSNIPLFSNRRNRLYNQWEEKIHYINDVYFIKLSYVFRPRNKELSELE